MTFYTISTCITHDISSSYFLRTSYIICIGRGRSKVVNFCPIPIALYCNKNMFKSKYQTSDNCSNCECLCNSSEIPYTLQTVSINLSAAVHVFCFKKSLKITGFIL